MISLQKKHGHRHKMDEEEVSCRDIEALAPMLPVELARAPDLMANTARLSAGTSKQGLQQQVSPLLCNFSSHPLKRIERSLKFISALLS